MTATFSSSPAARVLRAVLLTIGLALLTIATITGMARAATSVGVDTGASPHGVTARASAAYTPTIALRSDPATSVSGQAVALIVDLNVASPPAEDMTGNVDFYDGSDYLGSAALQIINRSYYRADGGPYPFSTQGAHHLRAVYEGDANYSQVEGQYTLYVACNSTVNLTASPSSVGLYDDVTITATLGIGSCDSGAPTGYLKWYVDGSYIGEDQVETLPGGQGIKTWYFATGGTHTVECKYISGDGRYLSSSASVTVNVANQAYTQTSVDMSPASSVFGQQVTLSAVIHLPHNYGSGSGILTCGQVSFNANGVSLGTANVGASAYNTAILNTRALPAGLPTTVTATFGGCSNSGVYFAGSTGTTNVTVAKADTTTTLSTSPAISGQGASVSLVAAVAPSTSTLTKPSGTVKFYEDTTNEYLGAADLASGTATLSYAGLSLGTHTIRAEYQGDASYNPSSGTCGHEVRQLATTTLTVTPDTGLVYGSQEITLSAHVQAGGLPLPTGSVVFKDGTTTLATKTLDASGVATFSAWTIAAGAHQLTAEYSGDSTYGGSSGSAEITIAKADTVTTVWMSVNPALPGQATAIRYAVARATPGQGTPDGMIALYADGSYLYNMGVPQKAWSNVVYSLGQHVMRGDYGGSANFNASSGSTTLWVGRQPDIAVSALPSTSVSGEPVHLTATVTSTEGTVTGTVTFLDGAVSLGSVTLNASGVAALTTSALGVGAHTITAQYAGEEPYLSASATTNVQVNKAAATLALSVTPATSVYGQSVTLTATVAAVAPGSGTPTGTVTFKDGSATLGSGTLDGSGVATFSTSGLGVGSHTVTAEYGGDTNFVSTSGTGSVSVAKAGTTANVTSAPAAPVYGQSVTLTAIVAAVAPGSGTPTGTVTFKDGSATLGSGTLSGGVATLSTTSLGVGSHTITAEYSGDGNVQGSSATCSVDVAKASTTTAVSAAPAVSVYGQAVTFTATVAAVAPGAGTPTGTVTFMDGSTGIGSGTLHASGVATLSISSLAVGNHDIRAQYTGDASYLTSSGALAAPYIVAQAGTTTSISSVTRGPVSLVGEAVIVNYGVSVTAPGAGTLAGTVTVTDGSDSCSGSVAAGSCSLALSTAGDRTLTATYAGDASFRPSTSAGVAQHVNTPPVARAGGPYSGDEGTAIAFDGSASLDADPGETATLRYQWTFGDGATGTGEKPSHSYAHPGSYRATLLVTDAYGASGSDSAVVTVHNAAPTLSGQFDQVADEGTLTSFDLGRFADPGAGPWAVGVSWGDGTASTFNATSAGALPAKAHSYDDNGNYTVTVKVTDENGASATGSFRAVIRNVAPSVTIESQVQPTASGTNVGLWAHPSDPSGADMAAGFRYQWSLTRDGVEIGTGSSDSLGFTIPAGDGAMYMASVQAKDKDGGIGGMSWHMRGEVRAALDARIQSLWPHGGAPVREATLANLSAWLLEPGTLHPAVLSGDLTVYLWCSLNNGPATIVATGVRRGNTSLYDFNNVDVAAARDAKNMLFFWVSVAGIPTHSNVWIHAQDGRTYAPSQDVPTAAGYSASPVDARIEILWPHGNAPVSRASLANLTAMLFRPGSLESVSPEWTPAVRLWRALDNGVMQEVGVGVKRLVTRNGVTYPVWDFDNVDVSAAQDAAHKLIFTLTVDGVEAHSSVWVHGADARTVFPAWDVVQ